MFRVVDYRWPPDDQGCGLEGRPELFSAVDYRGSPKTLGWWITKEAPGVLPGGLEERPQVIWVVN